MSLITLIIGFLICIVYLLSRRRERTVSPWMLRYRQRAANRARISAEIQFLSLPLHTRVIALSGMFYK